MGIAVLMILVWQATDPQSPSIQTEQPDQPEKGGQNNDIMPSEQDTSQLPVLYDAEELNPAGDGIMMPFLPVR